MYVATFLTALLVAIPRVGNAQLPQAAHAQSSARTKARPALRSSNRRTVPDYNGVRDETESNSSLLWIPRVLFWPFHVVAEYVVRWPLGTAVTAVERAELPPIGFGGAAAGGPMGRRSGIAPSALVDFGFRPRIGLYAWSDGLFFPSHALRMHASTWGLPVIEGIVLNRATASDGRVAGYVRFAGAHRDDHLFYGLGKDSEETNEARFQADTLDAELGLWLRRFARTRIGFSMGIRSRSFGGDVCCGEPSIEERASEGTWTLPPAFDDGYTAYRQRATFVVDARAPSPDLRTGVRLLTRAEHAFDLRGNLGERRWVRYGGSIAGFVDLPGRSKILGLSFDAWLVDSLGEEAVPFTEQITLGGEQLMRGFVEGRLIGESAFVTTLEYRWPVWTFMDGTLQVATGNVFGERLDGFALDAFRLSLDVGVRSVEDTDHAFRMGVGVGTDVLENGIEVSAVRFTIGASPDF